MTTDELASAITVLVAVIATGAYLLLLWLLCDRIIAGSDRRLLEWRLERMEREIDRLRARRT